MWVGRSNNKQEVLIDETSSFQCSLFLKITTLLLWLKSTLLLKIKCFDTIICMKTKCLQTNETQHYCIEENTWVGGWGRERVVLIKSLITQDRKDGLEGRLQKIEPNLSADILNLEKFWPPYPLISYLNLRCLA